MHQMEASLFALARKRISNSLNGWLAVNGFNPLFHNIKISLNPLSSHLVGAALLVTVFIDHAALDV